MSLNHLLSFTLPPRQHPPPRTSRRSARNGGGWGGHTRERYLNAQYRFILKPTGDYTVHFADPDIYFNWPDVLQVIVPTSSVLPSAAHTFEGPSTSLGSMLPSCPICLSEPTAPRMTKCGHIFCYPCLLHYLELAETGQKCRSCPICYDTVYARELKSVKWFDPVSSASQHAASAAASASALMPPAHGSHQEQAITETNDNDHITFRLIHRNTISTLALPRSNTWPSDLMPPHAAPWHFAPDAFTFSRFMLATPDYMTTELREDLRQLEQEVTTLRRLGTPADDLGLVFIESARRKVVEQIEKVATLRTELVQQTSEDAWLDFEALKDKEGAELKRRQLAFERSLSSAASSSEPEDAYVPPDAVLNGLADRSAVRQNVNKPQAAQQSRQQAHHQRNTPSHPSPAQQRNARARRNVNPPAPNDATYLFYQAASGQHIYLHPLDIKILKSHFDSYSAFPLDIRVRVEGSEEGSMNEELRKRCKYLSHLPEACDLVFAEVDLSSVMPSEALVPYAQALKKRSSRRKEKAKKDDRARIKSEQAAAERERESLMTQRYTSTAPSSYGFSGRSPGLSPSYYPSAAAAGLSDEEALARQLEDLPPLSTSPSARPPGLDKGQQQQQQHPQQHDPHRRKTVWGTQAIAGTTNAGHNHEPDEAELAMENAWQDFESVQQRGGRKQGRKKKVVLNLTGGAQVSMRR